MKGRSIHIGAWGRNAPEIIGNKRNAGFLPFKLELSEKRGLRSSWVLGLGLLFGMLSFFFVSCTNGNPNSEEHSGMALAEVGNQKLWLSDLSSFNFGENKEDSLLRLKAYVDQWVKEQVMLQQAENSLGEELKNIEAKLETYRKALLIFSFQEQMLAKNLDTLVSEEEVEAYYLSNRENFQLRQNIVRYALLEFPLSHSPKPKVKQWFLSKTDSDTEKLENYCQKRAKAYILRDTGWTTFAEIEKMVPLAYSSQELFLKQNKFVEVRDTATLYWLRLDAFRKKESQSPIEFEAPKIRAILLQQRKRAYLEALEQHMLQEAVEQKKAVVYVEP